MKNLIVKIKKHKRTAIIIILFLIGGYYWYNSARHSDAPVSYATQAATKQTLITSVSGSGQMSDANQVDLKPKVSGGIIKLAVTASQTVKQGDIIAQIDAADAYKAARDAQTSLLSAQLALTKLKQPASGHSKLQAQNALTSAQASLDKLKLSQPVDYQNAQIARQTANDNLTKAYSDAFIAISNVYLNLPNIISSLNDILYSDKISQTETLVGKGQLNISALLNSTYQYDQANIKSYQTIAESNYTAAQTAYNADYADFKSASIYSEPSVIENLLTETLAAVKSIAQAIKSENNYLNSWSSSRTLHNSSVFTQLVTYQTNLDTYAGQINSGITNLSAAETAIENDKNAITAANNNLRALTQNQPMDLAAAQAQVAEKQSALASLMAGADPLDIKTQELNVVQRQNALYDAQNALADYTIRAPFTGVIAAVNSKIGDPASSGTAIAAIITQQQVADVSLNEVDSAKIKVGQKVILTFDAIDGLELTGKVARIDAVGTVSQGVVSYNVKIILDAQDEKIKAGMSVNATIITNVKTDALTVPNTAVKTAPDGSNYARVLDASGQPLNRAVQTGLANDTSTEITSGLNESEKVVTQIINGASTAGSRQSSGSFGGIRIPGVGGGSGGNATFKKFGN